MLAVISWHIKKEACWANSRFCELKNKNTSIEIWKQIQEQAWLNPDVSQSLVKNNSVVEQY